MLLPVIFKVLEMIIETTADINKPITNEDVTSICQTLMTAGTSGGLCQAAYDMSNLVGLICDVLYISYIIACLKMVICHLTHSLVWYFPIQR